MRWSFDFHNINIPTSAHVLVRDIKQKNYDHDAHGDKVWNSCLALMDYLSEADIKDLEVMDVCCGWGVLSSFLAKKGANVQSVDCDKSIQPYYQLIKELNNTSSMLRIADIASLEERDFANIDWIVGSDICFWDEQIQMYVKMIRTALESGVAEILIADPGRETFWKLEQYCNAFCNPEIVEIQLNKPRKVKAYVMCIDSWCRQ